MSESEHNPHPANVPGDFYVRDDCCTMCEVPFSEAPELFGVHHGQQFDHCYVKRQPATPAEYDGMLWAIRLAEFQCVRYRGNDRDVQLKLVQLGEGSVCDALPTDLRQLSDDLAARQRRERPWWQRLADWIRGL